MPAINTVDHSPHPSLQPISNTFCFFFSTKIIKTKTIFGSNSFFLLPVTASSSDTTPNLATTFKGDIVEAVDGVCFLHRAVFVILDCQWLTRPKTMMALKISDTQKTLISLPFPFTQRTKEGSIHYWSRRFSSRLLNRISRMNFGTVDYISGGISKRLRTRV